MHAGHAPGITCPECSFRIPVDLDALVAGRTVRCPACGLGLEPDMEGSREALAQIQRILKVARESRG